MHSYFSVTKWMHFLMKGPCGLIFCQSSMRPLQTCYWELGLENVLYFAQLNYTHLSMDSLIPERRALRNQSQRAAMMTRWALTRVMSTSLLWSNLVIGSPPWVWSITMSPPSVMWSTYFYGHCGPCAQHRPTLATPWQILSMNTTSTLKG